MLEKIVWWIEATWGRYKFGGLRLRGDAISYIEN